MAAFQGRVEAGRLHLSPRHVTRLLLTRPQALSDDQRSLFSKLTAASPEMTSLAGLVRSFAALLKPAANQARPQAWAEAARACDLPNLHAFTRCLDLDTRAAIAAVTLPSHNGRTDGVNTKTKMIKRQMYGPPDSPSCATASCSTNATHRHHRK
jgi:transposase